MFISLGLKAINTKELNLLIQELCHEIYHIMLLTGFTTIATKKKHKTGPVRESNPGPLAPKARIMPLDQQAIVNQLLNFELVTSNFNILIPPAPS